MGTIYSIMHEDNKMHQEDREFMRLVSTALVKGVMWISIVVGACFWLSSCNVDKETIEACEVSCRSAGTHMQAVTSNKCECAIRTGSSQDIWVIPRATTNGQ